jgi:hypothetical protein
MYTFIPIPLTQIISFNFGSNVEDEFQDCSLSFCICQHCEALIEALLFSHLLLDIFFWPWIICTTLNKAGSQQACLSSTANVKRLVASKSFQVKEKCHCLFCTPIDWTFPEFISFLSLWVILWFLYFTSNWESDKIVCIPFHSSGINPTP